MMHRVFCPRLCVLPLFLGAVGAPMFLPGCPPIPIDTCDGVICPDDGIFCNGTEVCENGACISTGDPCDDDTACMEETDSCIDIVGHLAATRMTSVGPPYTDQTETTYVAMATFFEAGEGVYDPLSMMPTTQFIAIGNPAHPGNKVVTEEFGSCSVSTVTVVLSPDMYQLPEDSEVDSIDDLDLPAKLDAGASGTVVCAGEDLIEIPKNPGLFGNISVLFPVFYAGYAMPGTSFTGCFDAGEALTFSFPGGEDIGPFDATIDASGDLAVTTPDLADENLLLDVGSEFAIEWTPLDPSATINLTIEAGDVSVYYNWAENIADGDAEDVPYTYATLTCAFADTGSATVPAEAMRTLGDVPHPWALVKLDRSLTGQVEAPVTGESEPCAVLMTTKSGVTRLIIDPSQVDPELVEGDTDAATQDAED